MTVVAERHAKHFIEVVESAGTRLHGPDQQVWLATLDAEHDNLRAALTRMLSRGDGDSALRLACGCSPYWTSRGLRLEGQRWLEQSLLTGGTVPVSVQADAYTALGGFAISHHDYEAANRALERAIQLHRTSDNPRGVARSLYHFGDVAMYRGDYQRANDIWVEALAIARGCDDPHLLATTLAAQSLIVTISGEYSLAWELGQESLVLFQSLNDRDGTSMALGYLGYYALWQGELTQAERLGDQCLATAREGGGDWVAFAEQLIAHIALERGDLRLAGLYFRTSLEVNLLHDEGMMIADSFEGLAGVAASLGHGQRAATLLGAAEAVRERYDTPLPPPKEDRYARTAAALHETLRSDLREQAWSAGRQLSLSEAVEFAIAPDATSADHIPPSNASKLSVREVEVLRLVADGLSDREIAEQLFISHRTVMRHVTGILNKLGVSSRTAAATLAVREGLV